MKKFKAKKQLIKIFLMVCFLAFFIFPQFILAATNDKYGLETTAGDAGLISTQTDLPTIIGKVVNYFLGLLGVFFLLLVLVGGYLWMTAGGNEENIKKAKGFIIAAINGLIVVFLAYALAYIIIQSLTSATNLGTR